MSHIDVLRVAQDGFDTTTITVGDRWVEVPSSEIAWLVDELQAATPI